MNIVLMGGPGAGKGTQAELLIEKYGMMHISTGDVLRDAIANNTEEGKKAKSFMEAGELVPDQLIIDMMKKIFIENDISDGLILDGFPRSTAQAEALDKMLQELNTQVDKAILIDTPDSVIIERICSRRMCKNCGKIGSIMGLSKQEAEVYTCPECGGEMYQRADDNEETVKNRIDVYNKNTAPLIDFYDNQAKLYKVDGAPTGGSNNAKVVFDNLDKILH